MSACLLYSNAVSHHTPIFSKSSHSRKDYSIGLGIHTVPTLNLQCGMIWLMGMNDNFPRFWKGCLLPVWSIFGKSRWNCIFCRTLGGLLLKELISCQRDYYKISRLHSRLAWLHNLDSLSRRGQWNITALTIPNNRLLVLKQASLNLTLLWNPHYQ